MMGVVWVWLCCILTLTTAWLTSADICPSGDPSGKKLIINENFVSQRARAPDNVFDELAPTNFTIPLNDEDYTYIGSAKTLLCCAQGYDNISWYRRDSDHWTHLPYNWSDLSTPTVEDKGQMLKLVDVGNEDSTVFRCELIKHGAVVMIHDVKLIVQHCRPEPKPPTITAPFPENKTVSEYGGNLTLHCTGEFGCCLFPQCTDIRVVLWAVMDDNRNITLISPRYTVQRWHNADRTIEGANLTIAGVSEEDTRQTFLCMLMNTQQPSVLYSLQITKAPDVPDMDLMMAIILGSVFGLLIILLVSCCCYRLYGPQIKLYIKLSTPCCYCGKDNVIDEENFDHNAFLYLADEDEGIGLQIKEYLESQNYKIFLTTEITPGKPKMQRIDSVASRSAVVFFLYTENLQHDDLVTIVFYEFRMQWKKIIILEVDGAYTPEDAQHKAIEGQRRRTTELASMDNNGGAATGAAGIEHSLSTETDQPFEQDNNNENQENDGKNMKENKENKVDHVSDFGFWKRLPKIQVHLDEQGGRKTKNFLCELQNRIPKFAQKNGQKEDKRRATSKTNIKRDRVSSSRRPLLDSLVANTPNTPNDIEVQLGSPMSDQVFSDEVTTANESLSSEEARPDQNHANSVDVHGYPTGASTGRLADDSVNNGQLDLVNVDLHQRNEDSSLSKLNQSEANNTYSVLNDPDETSVLKLYESPKEDLNLHRENPKPEIPIIQEPPNDLDVKEAFPMPDTAPKEIQINEPRVGKRPSLKKGDSSETSDIVSPSFNNGQFSYKNSVSSGFSETSDPSSLENSGKISLENSGEHDSRHGKSDSDYMSRQTYSLDNANEENSAKQIGQNVETCMQNQGTYHQKVSVPLVLDMPRNGGQQRFSSESSVLSPESGYNTSRENSVQDGHRFPVAVTNNQMPSSDED